MFMKYIGIKEAAKKWGLSDRRVRVLCQDGRIEGAIKLEWSWTIPADAPKPFDGRSMRHYKSYGLRLGTIDIDTLEKEKASMPTSRLSVDSEKFNELSEGLLSFALSLEGRKASHRQISSLFSGSVVPKLSLDDHLLFMNFRSILLQAPLDGPDWDTKRLLLLDRELKQGVEQKRGVFRDGFANVSGTGSDGGNLRVNLQVETLMNQYEGQWKRLHAVFRSVVMFIEIYKIRPFDSHNELYSVLLLSSMLLSSGFLPPLLASDDANELQAALSLAYRRGNCQDLVRMVERQMLAAYSEMKNV